jgi:YD repeat-containing protein
MRRPFVLFVLFAICVSGCASSHPAGSITAAPAPAGVDQSLWRTLTAELERQVAAHPRAASAAASDAAQLTYDQGSSRISWYMVHAGDYNQDGLVTVSDLTPLAGYFNQTAQSTFALPDFPHESIQSAIDGDGNGEINLADITPIAANFDHQLEGYHVYQSADAADNPEDAGLPNGPGAQLVETVPIASATQVQGERRKFTLQVVPTSITQYFWVRPYSHGVDGAASNSVEVTAVGNFPPVAQLSAPQSASTPAKVTFDASGSHDPDGQIVRYEWDFDGDGVFETDWGSQSTAPYVYYEPGLFETTVRVTDSAGAVSTASTTIEVAEAAKWHRTLIQGGPEPFPTEHFLWDYNGTALLACHQDYDGAGLYPPVLLKSEDKAATWTFVRDLYQDSEKFTLEWGGIVANRPAVILSQASTVDFVRAGNLDMSSWIPPVALDLGSNFQGIALYLIDNKPTVFCEKGGTLSFMLMSDDTFGLGWDGDPVPLGVPFSATRSASIGGLPGTLELRNNDLLYLHLQDDSGVEWSGPTFLNPDQPIADGLPSRLLEVNGNPAVLFTEATSRTLKFVRALDATGSAWPAASTISSVASLNGGAVISIVDNRPAIVYRDRIDKYVKFVGSNDPDGHSWSKPIAVSNEWGSADPLVTLAEIGNVPMFTAVDIIIEPKFVTYSYY